MFNDKTPIGLSGVIAEFHWTNPHCSMVLAVSGAKGTQRWNIQLGPPTKLYQEDWKPMMFKPGTMLSVLVWPMRDGSHRALLISSVDDSTKKR